MRKMIGACVVFCVLGQVVKTAASSLSDMQISEADHRCERDCFPLTENDKARFSNKKGEPIPSFEKNCIHVNSGEYGSCFMDISELTNKELNSEDQQVMFALAIQCSSAVNIEVRNTEKIQLKNVRLSLSFYGPCIVNINTLSTSRSAMQLKVLELHPKAQIDPGLQEREAKPALKDIESLIVLNGSAMAERVLNFLEQHQWSQMISLQLVNFKMKHLPEKFKQQMPMLQMIYLHHNMLTKPPNFPWNNDELTLNLTPTQYGKEYISEFLRKALPPFVFPRGLVLDYNKIEDLEHFQFQNNLHRLSLRGNGLQKINEACFRNLTWLIWLSLGNNKLRVLPVGLLKGLRSLIRVNFDHNEIQVIPDGLFSDTINLERLYLNDNKIVTFHSKILLPMKTLQFLFLGNNKIKAIHDEESSQALLKEMQIKQIVLQNNVLQNVSSWMLELNNLEYLDMSSNLVTGKSIFMAINSTDENKMLNLLYEYGAEGRFSGPLNRRQLIMQNNSIQSQGLVYLFQPDSNQNGEAAPNYVKAFAFRDVYHIDFSNNPIICDCNIAFVVARLRYWISTGKKWRSSNNFDKWKCRIDRFKQSSSTPILSLVTTPLCSYKSRKCPETCSCYYHPYNEQMRRIAVDCRSRNLTEMPKELPSPPHLHNLQLRLEKNNITKLVSLPYLHNVTSLYLSYNSLSSISKSVFPLMTKIREIYLDHNKLKTLPQNIQNLTLEKLSLSVNLLKCDCNDRWMKHWLKRNGKAVVDIDKIRCVQGPGKGVPVVYVPDQDFVCLATPTDKVTVIVHSKKHQIIATVTGSIFGFIFLAVLLIYKFRKEIKVLAYAHFDLHPFDKVDDDENNQAIYDAFVSYNHHDSDWVHDVLNQAMENRNPPYRLCIHDRDFVVGATILENIILSVQQSKRVIIVLTPHYVRSQWCLMEFREAHQKVLQGKRGYLIIILLEDVNMDEMDEELKLYMRTNTFLSARNRWFWKKLFYAMPLVPIGDELNGENHIDAVQQH